MRFETTFVVLVCFVFCLCNGAPGGEVDKKNELQNLGRTAYTTEEDNLIMEELYRLIDDYKIISSKFMWEKILEKHRHKWNRKTKGFPQERTLTSLRLRFRDILGIRSSNGQVKIPERLMKKLTQLKQMKEEKGPARVHFNTYSEHEKNVFFDELLKPSCKKMFGASTLEAIHAKLEKNHRNNVQGFECKRSPASIRLQMNILKEKGQFPTQVIKKFSSHQKEGAKRVLNSSYSTEEDNLLFDELLKPSCEKMFSSSSLETLRLKLEKNHQDKVAGFENHRTRSSIRSHLCALRDKDQLPNNITEKFALPPKGASSSDISSQNKETDLEGTSAGAGMDEWIVEMIEELKNMENESEDSDDVLA